MIQDQDIKRNQNVNLTDKLIQWLIMSLFIYNDFVALQIVTAQNIEYMIAQIVLYSLQKLSFFYLCKNLKWSQALLELLEVGIFTIHIRDKNSKFLMIGYFLRVFFMLYCQLFIVIAQPTFQNLSLYKQILILVSQVLISIIITIAQSMKFRQFLTFSTRWLFQICLFGLFLLLLVSQKESVVIPYLIIKVIIAFLANIIIFRKQYQHIKNQIRYAIFAFLFYFCIDHGPFYEFRRRKYRNQKIVTNEVLLYTMHVFRLNQLLQIIDGCTIFLIDYSTSDSQKDYGKLAITKSPQDLSSSDFEDYQVLSYIRFVSQILLSIFVSSFLVNQGLYFYSDRWQSHPVFCIKKQKLKQILDFLSKNKNLIYFSGGVADIDKGQFSSEKQVTQELQKLVEQTINLSKIYDYNFYEIKIKDVNNFRLICNKGESYEIDYVLHDFFITALTKMENIYNKNFIYLEEDNQMTLSQKKELQDALNKRILNFGIQNIQVTINNQIFKQESKYQIHHLKVIAFYKLIAEYQLINPRYILYDLLN